MERQLGTLTRRPTGIFSPPERVFNDDNVVLKMRNSYPIDDALQAQGQAEMTTLVDNKENLNNLEEYIEKAAGKIADLKSMFDKNDSTLENMLSTLYDQHINY